MVYLRIKYSIVFCFSPNEPVSIVDKMAQLTDEHLRKKADSEREFKEKEAEYLRKMADLKTQYKEQQDSLEDAYHAACKELLKGSGARKRLADGQYIA